MDVMLTVVSFQNLGIFVTGSADMTVKVWKLFTNQLIKSIPW